MRFNILSDADWEARVDEIHNKMSEMGYRFFFQERDYGTSLEGITVVLMCQDPKLNLQQRVNFSKKEKRIYLDIMLDLARFRQLDQATKYSIIVNRMIHEIPSIIEKYKFTDFDLKRFVSDLNGFFKDNKAHV